MYVLTVANDATENLKYEYAKHTWHTLLAIRVKKTILTGRAVEHAIKRGVNMERVMSTKVATIASLDHEFNAAFNGFRDVWDYYTQGSLTQKDNWRRVAMPLLNVAARDDPVTNCNGMKAQELSAGNSNLLFLITETGGHTGWPVSMRPWTRGYDFMNEAIGLFIGGVLDTAMTDEQCTLKARGKRVVLSCSPTGRNIGA